jgi:hypothetical protein
MLLETKFVVFPLPSLTTFHDDLVTSCELAIIVTSKYEVDFSIYIMYCFFFQVT